MKSIQFQLPFLVDIEDTELKFILASALYDRGKLSLAQAADLAGISKRTFVESIGQLNISIFNSDICDLKDDLNNLQGL
ncbi:MAG: UPF0175 family protein [Candidatus Caenarcaniphilales bacterium]|nr:UPF0175 family protein [Candidatus Caenarcaniphilales bacterium]